MRPVDAPRPGRPAPPESSESGLCDEGTCFRVWTSGANLWHLAGEADLRSGPALQDAMPAACAAPGRIVLDCGDLSFIDVAGLRVIAQAALVIGTPITVNGANEMLRRAWSLLDLHAAAPNVEFST